MQGIMLRGGAALVAVWPFSTYKGAIEMFSHLKSQSHKGLAC